MDIIQRLKATLFVALVTASLSAYSVCSTPPPATDTPIKQYAASGTTQLFASAQQAAEFRASLICSQNNATEGLFCPSVTGCSETATWYTCTTNSSYYYPTIYGGITDTCKSGYSLSGSSCNLTDSSLVQCPSNCTANESTGYGNEYNGLACLSGCEIKQKGISAAALDTANSQIGSKMVEWVKTGGTCTTPGETDPVANTIDPNKSNCITNGARQLCLEQAKPGCGTVNGVAFCTDKVFLDPNLGRCYFIGSSGYLCAHGDPPPPISGESPPVPEFAVTLPVQDGAGEPVNGLPPASNGGTAGGTAPGQIGIYPGPSGNGTDGSNGQGNKGQGTSKNACETHPGSIGCMGSSSYWSHFESSIKKGISDLIGTDPGGHTPLTSHEMGTTYTPVPVSSISGCPSPVSASFLGQSVSVSFDPVCQYAAGIRMVILAVASAISLYILLGFKGGK